MSDDAKISQRYRELGAEEPPRALDEAILAASRRPARSWTQRWAVPRSLAAVVVLSVTVTLRIQHEQSGIEVPVPLAKESAPASPAAPVDEARLKLKVEERLKPAVSAPARERAAKPASPDEPKPFADARRAETPAAAAPSPAPAVASRADMARGAESSVTSPYARQAEERTARDAEAAARAPQAGPVQALAKRAEAGAAAKSAVESPERELERIAQLRSEAKHDEADKALAEFRKRYPDYKITDALRERVERR